MVSTCIITLWITVTCIYAVWLELRPRPHARMVTEEELKIALIRQKYVKGTIDLEHFETMVERALQPRPLQPIMQNFTALHKAHVQKSDWEKWNCMRHGHFFIVGEGKCRFCDEPHTRTP